MPHGCHPVGPSTDYLVCDECDYCAQTDPCFTSWENHWATHSDTTFAGHAQNRNDRVRHNIRRLT